MASCSCWLCGWDIVETSTRTEGPTKGSLRKKTYTKPLPPNAEVVVLKGETFAKVKPPKGRAVSYPVTTGKDGLPKIVVTLDETTRRPLSNVNVRFEPSP